MARRHVHALARGHAPNGPGWTTNDVPFALAPSITVARPTTGDKLKVTITATPQVRDGQQVLAIWDGTQIVPKTGHHGRERRQRDDGNHIHVTADTGIHRVRLRVHGIDSIIMTDRRVLAFDEAQR